MIKMWKNVSSVPTIYALSGKPSDEIDPTKYEFQYKTEIVEK